jgi:chromosome segregation protein
LYLKRLEIVGFKSFADKIRLDFLPGVTAVVGPNGSGKSNISDAMRWVLGEQSIKSLRGAKMDDVIFAGTELRKPLGMADVTMVLDNSDGSVPIDYSEISVTRKIFRSGESEYLINKSPVRLRDVLDLFYDTGLGKEAYSVIGQGKIDSILSVKAEERRSIFEEAAGIVKYKTRKQIAERKLEETDRNLLRLQDILTELGLQLGPLESQAQLAQEYLDIQGRLAILEVNYYGLLVNEIQTSLAGLAKGKVELETRFNDFEGSETVIDSEIEENRFNLLNQDNRINELNEDYYRIQNQIDKYLEQANFLEAKLGDLDQQEVEYQNSQAANRKRKDTVFQEQSSMDDDITTVKAKLVSDQTRLISEEQVLTAQNNELTGFETAEQNFKTEIIEILNEMASVKNKLNSATLQTDFISKQMADYQKKRGFLEKQIEDFKQELEGKKNSLEEMNQRIVQYRQLESDLARNSTDLKEELVSIESKNQEWKQRIRGLESKIGLLEEMEKSHQGYFQGVKALMDEAATQPFHRGIRGIVADLIKVKPGMELAIETALGSSLQNIVIETDQFAQEAIGYLKNHGKGRATFMPLNLIQNSEARTTQHQAMLQQNFCQPAVSLLQFAPEYGPAMNYMLGQTIVAPDLKTAVKLSTKIERSFRIVTPEGDLVNPGGSITGGSIDKRRLGLLSRKREIEDLKKENGESQAFLEKGLQTVKKIKEELQGISEELETINKQQSEAKFQKISLEREIETAQQSWVKAEEECASYSTQLEDLVVENERFDLGKEELAELIKTKELSHQELEHNLAELSSSIRLAKQSREETQNRITELKSRLSAGQQEQSGKIALKEQILKQTAEIDHSLEEFQLKLEQVNQDRIKIRETVATLGEKVESEKKRLSFQQDLILSGRQGKEQILVKIKDLENRQRNFRRKNNEFQNQIHRFDLQISQKTIENENIQRNLAEDYGLNWMEKIDSNWVPVADAQLRIDEMKSGLRELGTVNLASIDDYRQIKERFEFLTVQSQDLIKAKESLQKVITEIERTIVKRFNETFVQIKAHFKSIYGRLFEGGNSDLFLIDPDHPLESGIEIIAQPPGKKLQSLLLLSGGERAMTAIALLFSILSVKPSPFCILDEIDATLDEANVHRFALLLELFSNEAQFIVITHRHGTMEVANTLYGVTMEELGVSKLISLDLNQKAG